MGNTLSDDDSLDITRKAIIPFRVRNNGFQVDYKIFKFRSFKKAKKDEATDTKYDDSFLELNTRSKIVGDIYKVLTISAETISEEYANLRKNYYSRMCFGILTFFIGLVLTNIGLVQNELPKGVHPSVCLCCVYNISCVSYVHYLGRVMIIFGALLLILTFVTAIIVIYTDRRLKILNKDFVQNCVKILEKEKIVTWTASFQHLLFDIIYPYNGKAGVGAVILTPNPYFEMCVKTTDDLNDYDVHVNDVKDKKSSKLKLPIPQWAIDDSISEGPNEEVQPLMMKKSPALILPPSDDNDDSKFVISCDEDTKTESDSLSNRSNDLIMHSDVEDADNEEESEKILIEMDAKPKKKKKQNKSVPVKAPVAYTGFEHVSKENAAKIHGECVQRFFHDNPEDIEGHGEATALLLQPDVNVSEKAIVQ